MKLPIYLLILFFFWSCGNAQEESMSVASEERKIASVSAEKKVTPNSTSLEESPDSIPQMKETTIGPVFLPIQNNQDRLLEFQVDLSYQTSDLIKTRKDFLVFVSKYGFIENSSAMNSESPYMNVKMHIRSDKLYEALLELDTYGTLISENISTIDHTEGMVWEKIKTNREKIRYQRRVSANHQTTGNSRNWSAIEGAITDSENEIDQTELQVWKINDKVKWATLNVSFSIPTPADKIIVPRYQNAFVGIFNLFLELTYVLVWMTPVFVLIGLLYFPIRKVLNWMRKKY